jgi:peptidyl-prolyl cis-trans isomerase A (cyclophilin A)
LNFFKGAAAEMRKLFVSLFCLVPVFLGFAQSSKTNPAVLIKTDLGDIKVQIFAEKAPITGANFLRYVDAGLYKGTSFYRVVRLDNQPKSTIQIEIIQGGIGFSDESRPFPAIEHETTAKTGILHKDGVISMARSEPGTATSEFFICIGDQPELDFGGKRNPDGQGFAAFGRVIEGMDVVRKIQQQPDQSQMLKQPVVIQNIERIR